mgnify:CR=1 FL=1
MKPRTTLALLFALATSLAPMAADASATAGSGQLEDAITMHGIEREGDIPLPLNRQ